MCQTPEDCPRDPVSDYLFMRFSCWLSRFGLTPNGGLPKRHFFTEPVENCPGYFETNFDNLVLRETAKECKQCHAHN